MEIKVTKSATVDFHGQLTMGKLRDFLNASDDLPDSATITVNSGSNQMDGSYCTFHITEQR